MRSNIPWIYEGQQVNLRLLVEEDDRTFYQWRADLGSFALLPGAEGVSSYEGFAQQWPAVLQRTITLLAVTAGDGQPVGFVQAYDINLQDGWCFVLVYMAEQQRSQRIGLEAAIGFWDYLFAHFNFRKIYMDVAEFNLGWMSAIPAVESGVFQHEGRFLRHTLHDNQYWDVVRFALYHERWRENMRDFLFRFVLLGGEPAGASKGRRSKPEDAVAPLDAAEVSSPPEPAEHTLPARLRKRARGKPQARSRRVELVRRFLGYERQGQIDEIIGMAADDVELVTEMTGIVVGKEDVGNLFRYRDGMRRRAIEAGTPISEISWGRPEETGDSVGILASVTPEGTIKVTWSFDAKNKIRRILTEGPGEVLARYLLGNSLPLE